MMGAVYQEGGQPQKKSSNQSKVKFNELVEETEMPAGKNNTDEEEKTDDLKPLPKPTGRLDKKLMRNKILAQVDAKESQSLVRLKAAQARSQAAGLNKITTLPTTQEVEEETKTETGVPRKTQRSMSMSFMGPNNLEQLNPDQFMMTAYLQSKRGTRGRRSTFIRRRAASIAIAMDSFTCLPLGNACSIM